MPRDPEVLRHWRPEPVTERETSAMASLERGDFEVYRNKLELICWEAYQTFKRMGISPMIEAGDAAVGVYTIQGDLAVGIMGTQLHLINAAAGVKWMMRHFYEEPTVMVRQGDMFYANDPLYGGIHAPDQILFMPVYFEGSLVAWVAAASHETETGAKEPGGMPPSAQSRYDEGMLLSPIKVAENYTLKGDLVEMMENRVRDPRMMTHDLKARAACAHLLERRVLEILEKKGAPFLTGCMRRMIDEGVEAAHAKLASMNDGIYRTEIFVDNAGSDKFGLINCRVEIEKRGDRCTVRFMGSPRILLGNFNLFPHSVIAIFACYLFQFFFWELPCTTGFYEPFDFEFEEGSFFIADPEDATSLIPQTQAQTLTAVHACFEKMKFGSPYHDHVAGSWPGSPNAIALGGINKKGMPFSGWDQGIPNGVGLGARWDSDGIDVAGFTFCAIGEFPDSEELEHTMPVLPIFRSIYWQDAVGYGKFRGGRSIQALYRVHGVPFVAAVAMAGYGARPVAPGFMGGYPSRPVAMAIIRNHNLDELIASNRVPSTVAEAVERLTGDWSIKHTNSGMEILMEGDLILTVAVSGPGYGDVLERDPTMVMDDVRSSTISHRTARQIYHMVYDEASLIPDLEATAATRDAERKRRIANAVAYGEWEPAWLARRPPEGLLTMYGEWPYASNVTFMNMEPTEELLDEHVREGGAPRERASRY